MVSGTSPGPAPAAQARASNSRLTRSSWRTCPHRKLRRNVPRVDGALTVPPRVRAVPPVRNTSASSMQSPPASADATRVSILSPVFALPGTLPRSRRWSTSCGRPRCRAKVVCPASTIFAGWRQSVLPVHLLGLAPLLGSIGPVAGDVKLQDDGVVHDPVNRRGGGHGVGEDAFPLREDQV